MIAAGCLHSLALSASGQLYGWGFNAAGQIGDGTTTQRDNPVKVSLGSWVQGHPAPDVVSLFGGYGHSLALLSDGVLLAWGDNSFGQLGDGTGENSHVPVQVALPGGTKVTAIAAAAYNGLALTSQHLLFAWGDGASGALGNGTTADSNAPVRVTVAPGLRVTAIGGGPFAYTLFAIAR